MTERQSPDALVAMWMSERVRPLWFKSTEAFDQELRDQYADLYALARDGELADWERTAVGALALVIVLDQFPLNMFRGRPEAFATEAVARAVAGRAIERGLDRELDGEQKVFLYLPYMHSEIEADQDRSVELFKLTGNAKSMECSHNHRDIVRRFGRFPHRNAILGRESRAEELAYLASDEAFHG